MDHDTRGLERVASTADFSRELQALRQRAGLTIRMVARAGGTPLSTTADWFSGKHLPLDADQFARIIKACGETDPERVEAWQRTLARLRSTHERRGSRERLRRRRVRRLRCTVAVFAMLVIAVAGATGYALTQRAAARNAERAAMTAAKTANSRDIAVAADQLRASASAVCVNPVQPPSK